MNNNASKKTSLIDKIKSNKKLQYLIIMLIAVVIVIIFLSNFDYKKSDESSNELTNYIYNLEKKLINTLSKVDGAGEVDVVLTIESGMETVLAMETITKTYSGGTETIETPIIVNGKTVIVKELYPKVVGVLIVAEGANKISVISKLQQATVSLLDINLNQIEILTMK